MTKKELLRYLDRKDITIEGNLAKWNINMEGDINGSYRGTFVFKCFLTPTERLACGRLYRELLGPNMTMVPDNEENLAFTLAQIKYRISSAPPFWQSFQGLNDIEGDIPELPVLDAILEAALAAEFKKSAIIQQKRDEAIKRAKKAAEEIVTDKAKVEDDEEGAD